MSKQELKLKLKKKKEQKEKQSTKLVLTSAQRASLYAVQKQLQALRLKEILILASFGLGAALLRVPMQGIPSAEPLTFFAILAGWLFGRKKGFIVGASSLYISNFFMFGGHGPWTAFQALGFGIAGYLGGFLRKNASIVEIITITLISTLVFEILMNLGTPFMLGGASVFLAFTLAIPFALVHLVSNFLFAFGLKPAKKFIEKEGGFNERDICLHILAKYNINTRFSWWKKLGKKFHRN